MDAQAFTNLYTKQESDEAITPFQNETGFSLIRQYPKDTQYHKDGRRMFIKVALLEKGFFYGVDMTNPTKRGEQTDYVITDGEEYKRRVTNFMSDGRGDEFTFDEQAKKFKYTETGKVFSLNEFVDVLANNHLSDRLYWKRKANKVASTALKLLFWLADQHYDTVSVSIDKYHFKRDNKPVLEDRENIEPFFKYFYISKNLIFGILLLSFFVAIVAAIFQEYIPLKRVWHSLFGEFSLSNPIVVLLFFLGLFSSEKFSIWLNGCIRNFLMPEQNVFSEQKESFIERLHSYQYHNIFKLKINL